MTAHDAFLRCLAAGDPHSARVFWRSKAWTPAERTRTRRMLKAATTLAQEILP